MAVLAVNVGILEVWHHTYTLPLQETMKILDLMQDGNETSALCSDH